MRWSDFNGLNLMVSLSRFGRLTVRPWAASFVSGLLTQRARRAVSNLDLRAEFHHPFGGDLEKFGGACRIAQHQLEEYLPP